jgi:hypothetical protein
MLPTEKMFSVFICAPSSERCAYANNPPSAARTCPLT